MALHSVSPYCYVLCISNPLPLAKNLNQLKIGQYVPHFMSVTCRQCEAARVEAVQKGKELPPRCPGPAPKNTSKTCYPCRFKKRTCVFSEAPFDFNRPEGYRQWTKEEHDLVIQVHGQARASSQSAGKSPVGPARGRPGPLSKSRSIGASLPKGSDDKARPPRNDFNPSSTPPPDEMDTTQSPRAFLQGGVTPEPDESWEHWAQRIAIRDEEWKILLASMLDRERRLHQTLGGIAASTLHRCNLLKTMAEATKAQSEHLTAISLAFANFGKKIEDKFGMLAFSLSNNCKNLLAEEEYIRNDADRLRRTVRHFGQEAPIQAANETVQQAVPTYAAGGSDPARRDRIEREKRRQESRRGDEVAAQLYEAVQEEDSSEEEAVGEDDEVEEVLTKAAGKKKALDK
jgi:hypothetical protein